jgi:protocatechuate 4,5-dioxygenase beta chain
MDIDIALEDAAHGQPIAGTTIFDGTQAHQLDGARAGYINRDFDLMCVDKLVNEPETLTHYSNTELVRLAGSQGVELLMWLAARGALHGSVTKLHSNYHIPISNTASAVMLLESAAA